MAGKKTMKREHEEPDEVRYRKKHPQTSKSNKRANHKHMYEKVSVQTVIGWDWAKRCTICGRISNELHLGSRDFMRPDCRHRLGMSSADFYSLEELVQKLPGVPVYLYDDNSLLNERLK